MPNWKFIDDWGTFELKDPQHTSYLYFPLVNEAHMMSSVTPTLHGDAKTDHNHFLLAPVSVEDLHQSRAGRNFWVHHSSLGAWSASGNSARQQAADHTQQPTDTDEKVTLQAGLLWQRLARQSTLLGLNAEITSFIPVTTDTVEVMKVTLTNIHSEPLTFTPTAAVPLYGRSADSLRDHRHVTSLLHRIHTLEHGVVVQPTLSFDERGHLPNTTAYSVFGITSEGQAPCGFFPLVEDFVGEGGSLDWPFGVVENRPFTHAAGQSLAGYEAMGALRFPETTLQPGGSTSYVILLAVTSEANNPADLFQKYASLADVDYLLEQNQAYWQKRIAQMVFHTPDPRCDGWLRWVTLQPILRRLFGNSFLPYHDYGRGGRGWRDLWQDSLAMLLIEPQDVSSLLFDYFAGIRIDGSNATIIGSRPGEFIADRNNIARIWMDHGAWPYLTTRLYLDQSGDLDFLLRQQSYFKDRHTHRCSQLDPLWQPDHAPRLYTTAGEVYYGSILEHILVQHLTAFFNVGAHNNIRLENADWNDGLDMASEQGESVAFTALYASNLKELANLVTILESRGHSEVTLARELLHLLDTVPNHSSLSKVDYSSPAARQERLQAYFESTRHSIAGEQLHVSTSSLAADLNAKADYLINHLRKNEWIESPTGHAWFNGYYDNHGRRVEGDFAGQVRMTLTGQVFTLMGGIANQSQAEQIVRSVEHFLYDESVGGTRLNTDFGSVRTDLGRCFGFAYGHKENGAMFTHMTVMYACALYRRGFIHEGWKILDGIYQHCQDFMKSRMYPGLPEYITPRGRGVYPYLTGSAAWYLFTLLTQSFGVQGNLGDLTLAPALVKAQFDTHGQASAEINFAGRRLQVTYHNPLFLDFGAYKIASVYLNGHQLPVKPNSTDQGRITLQRDLIAAQDTDMIRLEVHLDARKA